jgi:hypothetical protein
MPIILIGLLSGLNDFANSCSCSSLETIARSETFEEVQKVDSEIVKNLNNSSKVGVYCAPMSFEFVLCICDSDRVIIMSLQNTGDSCMLINNTDDGIAQSEMLYDEIRNKSTS